MEGERRPPARPPLPLSDIKGHVVEGRTNSERNILKIKQYHDEAFLYIEQGLTCDELKQTEQAVTLYTRGLSCIDVACAIPHTGPACVGFEWQKAKNLIQKMERTRQQIQTRVENLISTDAVVARAIDDPPPSYEAATTPTVSDFDFALEASLLGDSVGNGHDRLSASATELFKIEDGVQIFFITKEGYVSAPSYPSALGIYKFRDDHAGPSTAANMGVAPVFLKVGDWTYPLMAGHSPVLHANWGSYIFPDVNAGDGNAVGVIIPDFVSPAQRAQFEQTLASYTDMRNQELSPSVEERRITESGVGPELMPPPTEYPARATPLPPGDCPGQQPRIGEERTSQKISRGIETAAEWISWGLIKGAEKTGELMKKGSTKLKEQIKPEEIESKIDPRAQKGVYYTRKATEGAVKVSGYLVSKLGQGTMYLARKAAPHVRKQGEKYLPRSFVQKDGSGTSKMDGVLEVAAGGVRGWATMYVGLEQSAKVLAKNIADETVVVVKHKYGAEAGELTENTLYSGANVGLAVHNTSCMGATAIAKRAAKDTGKAVIDFKDTRKKTKVEGTMDCEDKSTELRDS